VRQRVHRAGRPEAIPNGEGGEETVGRKEGAVVIADEERGAGCGNVLDTPHVEAKIGAPEHLEEVEKEIDELLVSGVRIVGRSVALVRTQGIAGELG
jgi:hypothetical protein